MICFVFFFKQKTAYELRISDWSSDVCSSDLKTAAKLITEYGGLEAALEAAPHMKKSKMQENLIEHADMARLSRRLVALHDGMDLPEPLDDLTLDRKSTRLNSSH